MSKKNRNTTAPVMEAMEPRRLMSYTPVGGDSLVNAYTTGSQTVNTNGNAVATDAAGNYVVTWMSGGQDGSGYGVYARAFRADGSPRSGEFRVNQATAGDQASPAIAMEANGDFAVVWSGPYTPPKSKSSYPSVFARRYDAAGQPLGGEVLVSAGNTETIYPTVAMDQDGDFVVVWQGVDADVNRTTSGSWGILAQRFDKNGQRVGSALRVNSYVPNQQIRPRVAMDATGSTFAVTWSSNDNGTAARDVYAKRYAVAADGSVAAGTEIKMNALSTGGIFEPVPFIAVRPDGGQFTVGWRANALDGSGPDTFARRFNGTGQPLTAQEFLVNTTTAGGQIGLRAAYDNAGNSIITWYDMTAGDVFAQAYQPQGNRDGGETTLQLEATGGHVAFQPDGSLISVSFSHVNTNTATSDVYVRRFTREVAAPTSSSPFGTTPVTTSTFAKLEDAQVSESQALLA